MHPRLSSRASPASPTAGAAAARLRPLCSSRSSRRASAGIVPKQLLVGTETSDDAAVYQINESQAIVATTDFFMPIVDDPFDFGAIAATNAISDVYAMGGTPLFALALVGMPINTLPTDTIRKILAGGESVCAKRRHSDCRWSQHRFGRADLRAGCDRAGASEERQAQRGRQARR